MSCTLDVKGRGELAGSGAGGEGGLGGVGVEEPAGEPGHGVILGVEGGDEVPVEDGLGLDEPLAHGTAEVRDDEVRRGRREQREPLLAVKRGEVPWSEVEARMTRLEREAEEAAHRSPLPAEPDRRRVEDFLVRVRRASALGADACPGGAGGRG